MATPLLPMTLWAAAAAAVVSVPAVVVALELPRKYTLPAGSLTCSMPYFRTPAWAATSRAISKTAWKLSRVKCHQHLKCLHTDQGHKQLEVARSHLALDRRCCELAHQKKKRLPGTQAKAGHGCRWSLGWPCTHPAMGAMLGVVQSSMHSEHRVQLSHLHMEPKEAWPG